MMRARRAMAFRAIREDTADAAVAVLEGLPPGDVAFEPVGAGHGDAGAGEASVTAAESAADNSTPNREGAPAPGQASALPQASAPTGASAQSPPLADAQTSAQPAPPPPKRPYPPPAEVPTQHGPKGLRFDFNDGCRAVSRRARSRGACASAISIPAIFCSRPRSRPAASTAPSAISCDLAWRFGRTARACCATTIRRATARC